MMLRHIIAATLLAVMTGPLIAQAEATGDTVEIMLVDHLDETRGYCLDVAGGQGKSAPIEKGLQAHTCYDYTGSILEDQGFDSALIEEGQFTLPYFEVCMSVPSLEVGAGLTLSECATEEDTQKFELTSNGQLVSQAAPTLCVTVNATEKKEGRGGNPVHVMRPVSLQTCEGSIEAYQTWSIYHL